MNEFVALVSKRTVGSGQDWVVVAEARGNSRETVNFLRAQIKWLLKEPYPVARFEGEEPLPGLEGSDEVA